MTQNIRQLYIVELVVGSEQKLSFLCCDSNQDNCHRTSPMFVTTKKHPSVKYNRVIAPGISHVACES